VGQVADGVERVASPRIVLEPLLVVTRFGNGVREEVDEPVDENSAENEPVSDDFS